MNGQGGIWYKDDTYMKVHFSNGYVDGLILLFNNHHTLQAIGRYTHGFPRGPFWVIYENHFIQVHFEDGYLSSNNIFIVNTDQQSALTGSLRKQNYVSAVKRVVKSKVLTKQCIMLIASTLETLPIQRDNVKLPIKIIWLADENRLMIRPAKMLYFNRVPKTASMSFAFMLKVGIVDQSIIW